MSKLLMWDLRLSVLQFTVCLVIYTQKVLHKEGILRGSNMRVHFVVEFNC